ncbi:guanine nucleotide binding protein, alpha subunit [Mycena latifolia]|nr:guanine nucleotide binding protein, alpha subunit [Mycena latifolia]
MKSKPMKKSIQPPSGSAAAQSAAIDAILAEDKRLARATREMVVLGIPGSGKATFMRHVKALHGGYNDEERQQFKKLIHQSVIDAWRELSSSFPDEIFSTPQSQECRKIAVSPETPRFLTEELAHAIDTLWTDTAVRAAIPTVQLDRRATHFFDHLDRISALDYTPTDDDILNCKMTPPPVDQLSVNGGDLWTYSLSCPRQSLATKHKWLPVFAGVAVVIFVLNLDDYDCPERIRDALDLYNYIYGSQWFAHSDICLLMNSSASLPAKLAAAPLTDVYPDGSGGSHSDFVRVAEAISSRFRTANSGGRWRVVSHHLTDVMAPAAVRATMDLVKAMWFDRLQVVCGL